MKIENITINFKNKTVFDNKTVNFEEASINWAAGIKWRWKNNAL